MSGRATARGIVVPAAAAVLFLAGLLGYTPYSSQTSPATASSSESLAFTVQTGTYSANVGDWVLANAASGAFAITLPSPATATNKTVRATKSDTSGNGITVSTPSGTIFSSSLGAASTFEWSTPYATFTFTSDGANWWMS